MSSTLNTNLVGSGPNVNVNSQVDPTHKAIRSSLKPWDWQDASGNMGGSYRIGVKTGAATAIAAAGAIFSARWNNSASNLIVWRVLVGFNITTAFTTSQVVDLDLVPVRGFTAPDTGGTTITLGNSNKTKSTMANSAMADMRIATTAALTAGTGTADANAMSIAACGPMQANNAVGAFSGLQPLLDALGGLDEPLTLAANEGFRVRIATAMGAAGVGNFTVVVVWGEVPSASQ